MRTGGPDGNERLTAMAGAVLLVLLAVEGVTILRIRHLLSLHMFVGMLLIPPVALKLASTGYRFFRYYGRAAAYRLKGPPQLLLRALAPLLVASTAVVFGTGVVLLATGRRAGMWVGLHKASFVVWGIAFGVHFLAYIWRLPGLVVDRRAPGFALRVALVAAVLAIGLWLADETALHDRFT
jgi:hypothetical protein